MKKIYLTLLILGGSLSLTAQTDDTKDGDEHFKKFEFQKAIDDYQELVDDGEATPYVYRQLGRAHYNLQQPVEAESYYAILVQDGSATPDDYFRYAQLLKTNNKLEKSKQWMEKFAEVAPNDRRAVAFRQNPDYAKEISQMPAGYTISNLDINTENSDFGGSYYQGKLYFVSARNKSRKKYDWNNQPTLDIYVAEKMDDTFANPVLLEGDINSKYHEGIISITKEGGMAYFSRNDYLDGDYESDEEGINQLKIYTARLVEGEWKDIRDLPINNSEYSTSHPALSPKGDYLYFSSDMPGGHGESDLYRVRIENDTIAGEPENLGPEINTPGKESFPFIGKDGTLYFSSTGHLGIGGMDVFYAQAEGNGFGEVKNMGTPVNSGADDFAFTYYPDEKMGFVSSNRDNPQNDDIYMLHPIETCDMDIMITVIDSETKKAISGADVTLYAPDGGSAGMDYTAQNGMAGFELPCDNYNAQADAEGYFSNAGEISKTDGEGTSEITIELDPEPVITETEVILNPIFFEFDKAEITPEAATELDRLVRVMKEHPDMVIEVGAHTDFRGPDSYNLQLSDRRAKSTAQYIISQGIDESRISGKGYGETMPKVACGGNCTDEEHALNRRSEFKIVGGDVVEKEE